MTLEEFTALKEAAKTDASLHPLLQALLIDAAGDWDTAHSIAQDDASRDGSRVHAFLHRVEGDMWNANYWYNRAGMTMPDTDLETERTDIARDLLNKLK